MVALSPGICLTCPAITPRLRCEPCCTAEINATYGHFDPRRRHATQVAGIRQYLGWCDEHGEQLHMAATGQCAICHTPARNPIRAAARKTGAPSYLSKCDAHGVTPHGTVSGKCLTCFTALGTLRKGHVGAHGDPARSAARRAGQTAYMGRCDTHGETPHGVLRGKCLTCFNAMGAPRPGAQRIGLLQRIADLDPASPDGLAEIIEAARVLLR